MRPTVTEKWTAPVKGWWQSGNLAEAPADAAEVLDNWFPTTQGVRVRAGCAEFADLGAAVKRLLPFAGAGDEDLHASTADSIFDCDRINGGGSNTWAEIESLGSGDWASAQLSNAAGDWMTIANGTDYMWRFDNTNWQPVAATTVYDLAFDAETAAFAPGQTVTGGTSGATATIYGVTKSSTTAGVLKVGTITGTFQDNETITDALTGSATSDIPSGTSTATTASITGIATTSISNLFSFKERLLLIEKNALSFWYLPVQSIGGAASEFDLGAVFRRGGYILFGASWSVDAGDGLDDVAVFVTDQGEVAIYQGTDPSSASTWSLVGIYEIGEPVNKHGFGKLGADLLIMTKDGIVRVSELLQKSRSELQVTALTFPIEDAWRDAVANSTVDFPITGTLWHNQTMLLCGIPPTTGGTDVAYVANSKTGAWCRYTGWDVRCSAVYADELYFGSNDGIVYKAETGGKDGSTQFTALCVPKFQGDGGDRKFLTRGNWLAKAPTRPIIKLVGLSDYSVPDISAPTTTATASGSTWGVGVWGTFVWGAASEQNTYSEWKKINGAGFAVSMGALVTSNDTAACDVELVSMRVRYEIGSVL